MKAAVDMIWKWLNPYVPSVTKPFLPENVLILECFSSTDLGQFQKTKINPFRSIKDLYQNNRKVIA